MDANVSVETSGKAPHLSNLNHSKSIKLINKYQASFTMSSKEETI